MTLAADYWKLGLPWEGATLQAAHLGMHWHVFWDEWAFIVADVLLWSLVSSVVLFVTSSLGWLYRDTGMFPDGAIMVLLAVFTAVVLNSEACLTIVEQVAFYTAHPQRMGTAVFFVVIPSVVVLLCCLLIRSTSANNRWAGWILTIVFMGAIIGSRCYRIVIGW